MTRRQKKIIKLLGKEAAEFRADARTFREYDKPVGAMLLEADAEKTTSIQQGALRLFGSTK
jgi:hypothetical protein